MKMPAATPTAAPLARVVAFSVTSALASSISSRTIAVVRSVISPSVVARFCGAGGPGSAATAPQQGGDQQAAEERAAHEGLGMLLDEARARADGRGDARQRVGSPRHVERGRGRGDGPGGGLLLARRVRGHRRLGRGLGRLGGATERGRLVGRGPVGPFGGLWRWRRAVTGACAGARRAHGPGLVAGIAARRRRGLAGGRRVDGLGRRLLAVAGVAVLLAHSGGSSPKARR